MKKLFTTLIALLSLAPLANADTITHCGLAYWITKIKSDGSTVTLNNGSVWEIDASDRMDVSLWVTKSEVTVCNGVIRNPREGESVDAKKIK